jgi:hypothetical protein
MVFEKSLPHLLLRNNSNAKERALRFIVTHMQADADDVDKTRTHIVRGEHFLEDEHRDWCRLLLEVEWFL